MRYRAVCTHGCRWHPSGCSHEVFPAARAHEVTARHRVHVIDASSGSLWPRELWTRIVTTTIEPASPLPDAKGHPKP